MSRIFGSLLEAGPVGIFILLTVILGGGAAFLTGRAIAGTWRPWWQVAALHAGAGRARSGSSTWRCSAATLLYPPDYVVDTAICLVFGFWGYRATRARQMAQQYGWLYRRAGLLGWARQRPRRQTPQHRNLTDATARFAARLSPRRVPEGGIRHAIPNFQRENSRMKRITALGLALGFAAALTGTGPAAAQIKIGVAGPLTGGSAAFGAQLKNGVEQAVADINAPGRHQRPEDPAIRRRRSRRPEGRRLGRQQVRGRRREIRDRPLQFRRHHAGIRGLSGERHPGDHAGRHQSEDHRTQDVERVPRLRP